MADVRIGKTGSFNRAGGNGGRGSFSYADTSVHGHRQPKSLSYYEQLQYHQNPAIPPDVTIHPSGLFIVGGGGGGARPKKLPFGSYAPGYSPNGVVLIRLTKID